VGKELIAKRLHFKSNRRNGVLITVDLTTIPENLVESELFGHEKGAFTGADRQKIGRIELADGGTLFLDEIGEIHPSIQVKLLRVLQEKSLMRVGGSSYIQSDFRLVAATNKDLPKEVVKGNFREDLFYRINVIPLNIPPLRERKEDILLLADHFLKRYAKKYNRKLSGLKHDDQEQLEQYHWPGNVRELKNIIERSVILSNDNFLNLSLPAEIPLSYEEPLSGNMLTLDEVQRRYIQKVLDKTGGRISGTNGAAAILGLKRTTLNARIKKFGIR
jgi:transcriptional regulator with GAF, ATPase, and Fis domain